MIRIAKPTQAPAILQTQGQALRTVLCNQHQAGATAFEFDPTVYGHPSVKTALRQAQHDKCCFCEAKIMHVSPGDIEHFRPKRAFCQQSGGRILKPGYFWLAYDWNNLLLSCEQCNRRHKRNFFPLLNPGQRASTPALPLANEQPLFINPALEDPAAFIVFRKERAIAINRNARGRITIQALGLNRPELLDRRQVWLSVLQGLQKNHAKLRQALNLLGPHQQVQAARIKSQLQDNVAFFDQCQQDSSEYSAMARAALA